MSDHVDRATVEEDQRAYDDLVADIAEQLDLEYGLTQIIDQHSTDSDRRTYDDLVADIAEQLDLEYGLTQIMPSAWNPHHAAPTIPNPAPAPQQRRHFQRPALIAAAVVAVVALVAVIIGGYMPAGGVVASNEAPLLERTLTAGTNPFTPPAGGDTSHGGDTLDVTIPPRIGTLPPRIGEHFNGHTSGRHCGNINNSTCIPVFSPRSMEPMVIDTIGFVPNTATLLDPVSVDRRIHSIVAQFFLVDGQYTFEVKGFTAAFGDTESSRILSQERAAAIGELLAEAGVARSDIRTIGVGFDERADLTKPPQSAAQQVVIIRLQQRN